jgi:hypothetical protein
MAMIHAKDLFPIALDRIRDHLERGNASSGNPETKRKGETRKAKRVRHNCAPGVGPHHLFGDAVRA